MRKKENHLKIGQTIVLLAILLVTVLFIGGCDDPRGTVRAAEAMGFRNVIPEGYSFWGCGKDDTFSTKFSALNQNGRRVTGVVCSGWFKGSTVRID